MPSTDKSSVTVCLGYYYGSTGVLAQATYVEIKAECDAKSSEK